jgi:hypothetical protein
MGIEKPTFQPEIYNSNNIALYILNKKKKKGKKERK